MLAQGRTGSRSDEMDDALNRWRELKAVKAELGEDFDDINGLESEGIALATAFERGYALTGSLRASGGWDSHTNNFNSQSNNRSNNRR